MPLFGKNRATKTNVGCGFILSQGILICLLLVINGFIVRSTVILDWGEEIRIAQTIRLVLPIAMIFAELWLLDFVFAAFTRHKT